MSELLILLAIGLLAGILSGTLGVGGGVLIVPALIFILGYSQHEAQGTSLAIMIPPIGILAALKYSRMGYVNWRNAIILSLIFVVGAYLGSLISVNIPDRVLRKLFGIFMLLAALKMIFSK
ncbi:sulfite exporter TauE/SafE family protein [Saccharicrinis sp. FJH2]|uniref:sulfite exporter TauE/SafE family protein n=1 Tax=Saccharicrinis sp. FJH65 TaxID=3344659 RepID=UPI0035F49DCB